MSRFYELLKTQETPPGAFRGAQLWLRDLTEIEQDRYLATRPALNARRDAVGRQADDPGTRRYASINDWAAFAYTGA